MAALIADFSYAFKQTFASKDILLAYMLMLGLRGTLPLLLTLKNICCKVCIRANNLLGEADYVDGYDL